MFLTFVDIKIIVIINKKVSLYHCVEHQRVFFSPYLILGWVLQYVHVCVQNQTPICSSGVKSFGGWILQYVNHITGLSVQSQFYVCTGDYLSAINTDETSNLICCSFSLCHVILYALLHNCIHVCVHIFIYIFVLCVAPV